MQRYSSFADWQNFLANLTIVGWQKSRPLGERCYWTSLTAMFSEEAFSMMRWNISSSVRPS